MLKKISQMTIIILLSIFSFYYTNKSIEIISIQDPLMKEIKNKTNKYNIEATKATIKNNTIIPGINGKEIDYETSYKKMKEYGNYNEFLITLKDVKPAISINDNYDKYIISGNKKIKSVALVFVIENTFPSNIIKILNSKNIKATFFVDGIYIENNYQELEKMNNFELELLSYNFSYNEVEFVSSKNYLEALTNKQLKFCYSEKENDELIELCQKLKMHTIIPTIKIKNNLYKEIKENLSNSIIISIPITSNVEKKLSLTINYIKSRGYTFKTLEELISENIDK